MIVQRRSRLMALSALSCIWVLSCSCARTHDVDSFLTVHESMRLSKVGGKGSLATVDEMIESRTAFSSETLSFRPSIDDYTISVQFDTRPREDQPSRFQELNRNGLRNPFLVFRGPPPLTPLVLESKFSVIGVLGTPTVLRSKISEKIREGDELAEIPSIRYEIGWNEYRLEGRAHIARSTHQEVDYLLD